MAEPKAFVRERDSRAPLVQKWWYRILLVALIALVYSFVLLLLWFIAAMNPNKNPRDIWTVVPFALSMGVLAVYVIPWIIRQFPSYIQITDKWLTRVRGNKARWDRWQEVESYTFSEWRGLPVLLVVLLKKDDVEIGLDASVDVEALRQFLDGLGIPEYNEDRGLETIY